MDLKKLELNFFCGPKKFDEKIFLVKKNLVLKIFWAQNKKICKTNQGLNPRVGLIGLRNFCPPKIVGKRNHRIKILFKILGSTWMEVGLTPREGGEIKGLRKIFSSVFFHKNFGQAEQKLEITPIIPG